MIKYILVLFLVVSGVFANNIDTNLVAKYKKDFRNLSSKQLDLAKEIAYKAKAYGLSLEAVAIAWQESNLGEYPINLQDPSCGPFHININTYVNRYNIKKTGFHKNRACSMLVNDIDVSVSAFIAEYEAWKVSHNKRGNISSEFILRSYNAGYNYNSEQAKVYAKHVLARMKAIEELIDELQ